MPEHEIEATGHSEQVSEKDFGEYEVSYQEIDNGNSGAHEENDHETNHEGDGTEELGEEDHNQNQEEHQEHQEVIEETEDHGQKEQHGDEGHEAEEQDDIQHQQEHHGHEEQHDDQVIHQDEYANHQSYDFVENLQRGIQYAQHNQDGHDYHGELSYETVDQDHNQDHNQEHGEGMEEQQEAAGYMLDDGDQDQNNDMSMQGILPEHSGVDHTLGSVPASSVDDVRAAHEAASHVLSSFTQSYANSASAAQAASAMDSMSNGSQHHSGHVSQGGVNNVLDVKPLTPKFNRGRNWSPDETRLLLEVLLQQVNNHPEDRRDLILRRPETFETAAEILKEQNFMRDNQACLVRWRNLLRIYKQHRQAANENDGTDVQVSFPFAQEIEQIYQFSPDSLLPTPGRGAAGSGSGNGSVAAASPGLSTGQTRSWSQANGNSSYQTPIRKRPRESTGNSAGNVGVGSEVIERIEQKIDQQSDIISQQFDLIRSQETKMSQLESIIAKQMELIEGLRNGKGANGADSETQQTDSHLEATGEAEAEENGQHQEHEHGHENGDAQEQEQAQTHNNSQEHATIDESTLKVTENIGGDPMAEEIIAEAHEIV
ncbi:hypothetical protein H4219_003499 [Mycoemilia scoparia]|uniref:Myb/SANT-like DNA-binding domain-containing protein n=1 Tax=Mycoemilia scoparia TaxID=417184 RepID=A0A9W7ZUL0_9FUNG|nr:hypothetical protein H4219_003499 [Mycoemilia scoparia]